MSNSEEKPGGLAWELIQARTEQPAPAPRGPKLTEEEQAADAKLRMDNLLPADTFDEPAIRERERPEYQAELLKLKAMLVERIEQHGYRSLYDLRDSLLWFRFMEAKELRQALQELVTEQKIMQLQADFPSDEPARGLWVPLCLYFPARVVFTQNHGDALTAY